MCSNLSLISSNNNLLNNPWHISDAKYWSNRFRFPYWSNNTPSQNGIITPDLLLDQRQSQNRPVIKWKPWLIHPILNGDLTTRTCPNFNGDLSSLQNCARKLNLSSATTARCSNCPSTVGWWWWEALRRAGEFRPVLSTQMWLSARALKITLKLAENHDQVLEPWDHTWLKRTLCENIVFFFNF